MAMLPCVEDTGHWSDCQELTLTSPSVRHFSLALRRASSDRHFIIPVDPACFAPYHLLGGALRAHCSGYCCLVKLVKRSRRISLV